VALRLPFGAGVLALAVALGLTLTTGAHAPARERG
jgi:hypothetical protein